MLLVFNYLNESQIICAQGVNLENINELRFLLTLFESDFLSQAIFFMTTFVDRCLYPLIEDQYILSYSRTMLLPIVLLSVSEGKLKHSLVFRKSVHKLLKTLDIQSRCFEQIVGDNSPTKLLTNIWKLILSDESILLLTHQSKIQSLKGGIVL